MSVTTPYLTTITAAVAEAVTVRITGTITDATATAIPAASLTTLTLTLYLKGSGAILNSVNGINILNTGRGTVDNAGALVVTLSPADNAITNTTAPSEVHVAQVTWTYNSGAATGRALVEFTVTNLPLVP